MKFKSTIVLSESEIINLVSQIVSASGNPLKPNQITLCNVVGSIDDDLHKTLEISFVPENEPAKE